MSHWHCYMFANFYWLSFASHLLPCASCVPLLYRSPTPPLLSSVFPPSQIPLTQPPRISPDGSPLPQSPNLPFLHTPLHLAAVSPSHHAVYAARQLLLSLSLTVRGKLCCSRSQLPLYYNSFAFLRLSL